MGLTAYYKTYLMTLNNQLSFFSYILVFSGVTLVIKKERNLHLLWRALVFQESHWRLDLVIHFGGHFVQGFYKEHLVNISQRYCLIVTSD